MKLRRAAVLLVLTSCSSWDAAVGVRCDQYPSFCRAADGGSNPALVDASITAVSDGGTEAGAHTISFARDIRPLMDRTETDPAGPGCSNCHYRNTGIQMGLNEAQLDLTTLGSLRKGGKTSGSRIVIPGNPDGSAIVQKLRGTYGIGSRMPWSGPPYWTDAEIQRVATWIAEGAQGADDE